MHQRSLCRRAVSVCVSVTFVKSVETSNRIVRFSSLSGRPIILVVPYQTGWQYSDRNPITETSNASGMKKITIFDQYLALSRNWCKIEPLLLWKANRKLHPSFRMVPFWMILSDRYGSGTIFRSISHLLRHFLSSTVAWRRTSPNSVTHNCCCRAH